MLLRIFTEPQQGASYDDLLAVAQASESLGFDAFFRSDHYLAMGAADGLPGPSDAWVTLAGIARETTRIRLGTLLTAATFRLPGPLAITVAGVDAMSGGRVELGLGAGWFDSEHTAYGIPFPPLGERFERLEEQLAVITGLWGTPDGERFSFDGAHYQLADSPALPKPVQRPGPPIIVGGGGAVRTPRLAARFGSEFNMPFSTLEDTRNQYDRVAEACRSAGRDPSSMVLLRRPGRLLRPGRRGDLGPGRGHRPVGGRPAGARPVRHAGRGGGQTEPASPRRGPAASTCRCWTCTTSTISTSSPARSFPAAPTSDRSPGHRVDGPRRQPRLRRPLSSDRPSASARPPVTATGPGPRGSGPGWIA